jgi:molecular chaperone GrpE
VWQGKAGDYSPHLCGLYTPGLTTAAWRAISRDQNGAWLATGLEIRPARPILFAYPFVSKNSDMSDNSQQSPNQSTPAPEEVEAAMAAHASDEMARLQGELAEIKAKSAELADQFLRAKAEAENARRRAEDEVSKARKFGIESFAESLLPVADSLDAALAIQNATAQQLREGSDATLRQLTAALERNKVLAINPAAGDKFDPHQHQAISVVPADQEANTVVSVLQKGYLISERVLRPALVTVTAPK